MTRRTFGLLTGAAVAQALLPAPDAADAIIPQLTQADEMWAWVYWNEKARSPLVIYRPAPRFALERRLDVGWTHQELVRHCFLHDWWIGRIPTFEHRVKVGSWLVYAMDSKGEPGGAEVLDHLFKWVRGVADDHWEGNQPHQSTAWIDTG